MNKQNMKKMISKVLDELEALLHVAVDENRTGNLNVFEMIMVSADTLDKAYRIKKTQKKAEKEQLGQVIEFKRK